MLLLVALLLIVAALLVPFEGKMFLVVACLMHIAAWMFLVVTWLLLGCCKLLLKKFLVITPVTLPVYFVCSLFEGIMFFR